MEVAERVTKTLQFPITAAIEAQPLQHPVDLGQRCHLGEAIEPAPDPLWRTLFQQQFVTVADQQHDAGARRNALLGLAVGVVGGLALRQPLAIIPYRTSLASGLAAGTDGGPHVHHGLVVLGHPQPRGEAGRYLPQLVFHLFLVRPARQGKPAGEHPLHVAIENGVGLPEGEGEHGASGGATNARQGHHLVKLLREDPLMLIADLPGRLVQIAGPGVVAKTGPVVQHFVYGGIRQRYHIGKARHETLVIRDHSGDLGLLQHDFGDPDPIGSLLLLPGQGLAAVELVPVQHPASEG